MNKLQDYLIEDTLRLLICGLIRGSGPCGGFMAPPNDFKDSNTKLHGCRKYWNLFKIVTKFNQNWISSCHRIENRMLPRFSLQLVQDVCARRSCRGYGLRAMLHSSFPSPRVDKTARTCPLAGVSPSTPHRQDRKRKMGSEQLPRGPGGGGPLLHAF